MPEALLWVPTAEIIKRFPPISRGVYRLLFFSNVAYDT